MSQWIEDFKSHTFHDTWSNLKEALRESESNEGASNIDKENLARLKKVVSFIDEILENIDPELFPKDLLSGLNSQTNSCKTQITNFNSNKNVSHVNSANTNIDNVLKEVKPYIFYDAKIKKSLRSAIYTYISEIDKHLENISNTKEEYDKAQEYRKDIEIYYTSLLTDDKEESIKTQIDSMLEVAKSQSEELDKIHDEILVDDENDSTKTIIEESKQSILRDTKDAKEKLVEVSSEIEELEKFYVKVFGKAGEEGKRAGGLKNEIEQRLSSLESFKKEQEESYATMMGKRLGELKKYEKNQKEKQESLYNEIESLLPGATSAGLAKAYQEMKESFIIPVRTWNVVFIVALVGMFFGAYKTLGTSTNLQETINHLLHYAPLYVPAVWLAIFASKRRSENIRLAQEYAHKEAVAKSYASYKKQIEELKEEDQKLIVKLLNSAIDTISNNPSETLDKRHEHEMPLKELIKSLLGELKAKK